MDDSYPNTMKPLNRLECHGRVISYSSSDTQPGALSSNENAEGFLQLLLSFRNSTPSVTTDLLKLASMADKVAPRGIDSQQTLQGPAPRTSMVPPASSVANGMLTFEQQLASLNEELQRRRINRQLAFSIEQQQGIQQSSFQAKNFVLDIMPSIEQQPPSLNDEQLHRRDSYQAPRDQKRVAFSLEEQLASLIEQHRVHRVPFQDRNPTMEEQSASSACRVPPKFLAEQHQTSHVTSLERLQILAQLQRGIVPQARPEKEAPVEGYPFCNADQGHLMDSLQSGLPTECPLPVPPPFGAREPFPGKLYRLLAEAEGNGNKHIISFTPDGCAFKIHSRERFMKEVSSAHFSQAKITSFVRQLNFMALKSCCTAPTVVGLGIPIFDEDIPSS